MSLLEVEFKGRRKGIFSNPQEFPLRLHDLVVVKADRGEDLGLVSLIGSEWESRFCSDDEQIEIEPVLRRADENDIQKQGENQRLEKEARGIFIDLVRQHELVMKLVDIEYQLDHRKLTFYFTADGRVDFRALVKDLAHHFRTRIDLRQIGARDEAKRLGGIGICGRVLCCCAWIREFQPVTTNMVKEQHLLLNPQKNTGLCGRLRCCLRYEVDQYRKVNLLLPKPETKVIGPRGEGVVEKIDMCFQTCGIAWSDGTKFSFTCLQLKELTDWDPELEEQNQAVTFHKDPTLEAEKAGRLVAGADAPTTAEIIKPGEKKQRKSGSSRPEGDRKKTERPERASKRKETTSQKVVLVEAVQIKRSDEEDSDFKPGKKSKRPHSGKNQRTSTRAQKKANKQPDQERTAKGKTTEPKPPGKPVHRGRKHKR